MSTRRHPNQLHPRDASVPNLVEKWRWLPSEVPELCICGWLRAPQVADARVAPPSGTSEAGQLNPSIREHRKGCVLVGRNRYHGWPTQPTRPPAAAKSAALSPWPGPHVPAGAAKAKAAPTHRCPALTGG